MTDAEADPLLDLFRAELREQATTFERGLLDLALSPNDAAPLADLAQAAHTVRGASRILGYDAAARIAAGLEGRFAAAQSRERTARPADPWNAGMTSRANSS